MADRVRTARNVEDHGARTSASPLLEGNSMRLPLSLLSLVGLSLLAACVSAEADPTSAGESALEETTKIGGPNPIVAADEGGVADPGVLADGGKFYMVSTGGGRGMYPIRVSDDLVSWKHVGYVFP